MRKKETRTEQPKNKNGTLALKIVAASVCLLALITVAVTGVIYLQYKTRVQKLNTLRQNVYSNEGSTDPDTAAVVPSRTVDSAERSAEETAVPISVPAEIVSAEDDTEASLQETTVPETSVPVPTQLSTCQQVVNFSKAHQTNADIYAWLTVPGTTVNYPVLQAETDDYYLKRNLDGSSGYPGCAYTNASCNNHEFTDSITVVYGHNMPEGTMFTSLHNFEDPDVFNSTESFTVYTETNRFTYELVAAVWYNDDYIPYYYDTTTDAGMLAFWHSVENECDFVNEPSIIREGTEITAGDKLCVLSTCCRKNGSILQGRRYLVIGRLLETAVCE